MTLITNIAPLKRSEPFLKWAGGKRWLTERVLELIPSNYDVYIEPFLGSGAVYFSLQPSKAILSDLNADLINAYSAIKTDWEKVHLHLLSHHNKHCADYYYEIRKQNLRALHTKAAKFIYLNRTCWNGLYRVNLKGQFNVPIGTKKNAILDTDDFEATSLILKNAELSCVDFEDTINRAQRNDVIFADPPYTVHHNNNGFIKYNETIFRWEDQLRLRDALFRAKARGVKTIITNANHESVRKLYQNDFEIEIVSRMSVIAGSPSARRTYEELLIYSV